MAELKYLTVPTPCLAIAPLSQCVPVLFFPGEFHCTEMVCVGVFCWLKDTIPYAGVQIGGPTVAPGYTGTPHTGNLGIPDTTPRNLWFSTFYHQNTTCYTGHRTGQNFQNSKPLFSYKLFWLFRTVGQNPHQIPQITVQNTTKLPRD
ncbi:hypothetical protein DFH27DRAFT_213024 [Peziza echinospora]|nr:hypothetical protein DFH27DRAFT_213024 [Peziza echinospora]